MHTIQSLNEIQYLLKISFKYTDKCVYEISSYLLFLHTFANYRRSDRPFRLSLHTCGWRGCEHHMLCIRERLVIWVVARKLTSSLITLLSVTQTILMKVIAKMIFVTIHACTMPYLSVFENATVVLITYANCVQSVIVSI